MVDIKTSLFSSSNYTSLLKINCWGIKKTFNYDDDENKDLITNNKLLCFSRLKEEETILDKIEWMLNTKKYFHKFIEKGNWCLKNCIINEEICIIKN